MSWAGLSFNKMFSVPGAARAGGVGSSKGKVAATESRERGPRKSMGA